MISMDEIETRYRRAVDALDALGVRLDAKAREGGVDRDTVARVQMSLDGIRAHLWAAELGLRIHQARGEGQ